MANDKKDDVTIEQITKTLGFICRVEGVKNEINNAKSPKDLGRLAAARLTLNEQSQSISGAYSSSQLARFLSVLLDLDKDESRSLSARLDAKALPKEERDALAESYKKDFVAFISGFFDEMIRSMDENVNFLRVLARLSESDSLPSAHGMDEEGSNVGFVLFYKDKKGRRQIERISSRGKYASVFAEIKNTGVFVTEVKTTPRALIQEREIIEGTHEKYGHYKVCTREYFEEHGAPDI